jgi:hypothetical protein
MTVPDVAKSTNAQSFRTHSHTLVLQVVNFDWSNALPAATSNQVPFPLTLENVENTVHLLHQNQYWLMPQERKDRLLLVLLWLMLLGNRPLQLRAIWYKHIRGYSVHLPKKKYKTECFMLDRIPCCSFCVNVSLSLWHLSRHATYDSLNSEIQPHNPQKWWTSLCNFLVPLLEGRRESITNLHNWSISSCWVAGGWDIERQCQIPDCTDMRWSTTGNPRYKTSETVVREASDR